MIKYFLVNNTSRAAAYGIGSYIKQLTDCLRANHPQYELCFLDIYSDVKEFTIEKDEKGIYNYRIPSYHSRGNSFPYYRCILYFLDSHIKDEDHVIFHFNYSQHFDLIRLIKAKYKNCCILYTIHYFNWCFTLNGNLTHFRKLINNEVEEPIKENIQNEFQNDMRLFSLCDKIIVLSRFTYDLLRIDYKINVSKIHLIYNGLKTDSSINLYRNNNSKLKNILFVGRLDEIKGIEYIIKAFKFICTNNKNVHLTLVGDGDFSQYLKLCDGFWEKVTFTGRLDKEKLEQFFCQATIGIQPSFHEQCSYSAIEMMAHGIPFIATDSTGLGEMMDYTPECLILINEEHFQPNDFVEQLAKKMESLLYSPQLREQVSINLQRLFQERYILSRMEVAMGKLLETCKKSTSRLSTDFLRFLDMEMINLIDKKPAIDADFVGLTGIGCYLWWRIETLKVLKEETHASNTINFKKHMTGYIDWLYDVLEKEGEEAFSAFFEPVPLNWLLNSLMTANFYKTKVDRVRQLIHSLGIDLGAENIMKLNQLEIVRTALKIYNLNF